MFNSEENRCLPRLICYKRTCIEIAEILVFPAISIDSLTIGTTVVLWTIPRRV